MSRIGKQIQAIRIEKNLTHKQLAKKVGVAAKNIMDLETGLKIPNEDLIRRLSKALGKDINDSFLVTNDEDEQDTKKTKKESPFKKKVKEEPVVINDMWKGALNSLLATIPVYKYDMKSVVETKQKIIVDGKVEGFSKDKVAFIKIENDFMAGYRLKKNDVAFATLTKEIVSDSIYLVERKDKSNKRELKKVKRLDATKVILLEDNGINQEKEKETVNIKNVNMLARLINVEFKL